MQTVRPIRSAIRPFAAIASGVIVLCSSACADHPTLTSPSLFVEPLPSSPGPVAVGPSNAVLAMSSVSITVAGPADQPGTFYFITKFGLTETGGTSGATIKDIWVSLAGGDSSGTGDSCWRTPIRVAPGATTDAFDAGWDELSYCAPFAVGRVPATVTIDVSFVDDDGRYGSVETTTIVTR